MDVIVTARIPEEIKEQSSIVLAEIGATQSQLINAAFNYVLEHKRLPEQQRQLDPKKRTLSKEQKQELIDSIRATTLSYVHDEADSRSNKEIIAEGKKTDCETLA